MIYAKVVMQIHFEMNLPMQGATDVAEIKAVIDKDGGPDAFIKSMSDEMIKQMNTPFTTGKVTCGTVEIVEI